jgi:hypothetical protein
MNEVTPDVSGKTLDRALKALIAKIPNAEGVVMIRTPNSGTAQRRYLPRPLTRTFSSGGAKPNRLKS